MAIALQGMVLPDRLTHFTQVTSDNALPDSCEDTYQDTQILIAIHTLLRSLLMSDYLTSPAPVLCDLMMAD
jgi:hypothetical protein